MNKNLSKRSFGLIEAIAASTIIIIVVSGAVALAAGSMKSSLSDQSYLEAENIAEGIFEKVQEKKSQGKAYFVKSSDSADFFPVQCFDVAYAVENASSCFDQTSQLTKTGLGYKKENVADNFVSYTGSTNPAFGDNFFSYNVVVSAPSGLETSTVYPTDKIVNVKVVVKWNDVGGEKKYYARQYFSDWER